MSFEHLEVEAQQGLKWSELPALPDTLGRAGMYAGVSAGFLFCIGGANFPNGYPWEGGKKVWHDDIFMLDGENRWTRLKEKLPNRLAYGVSVSYNETIILVGGSDEHEHYANTLALKWEVDRLLIEEYPALPLPLANMAGTLVDSKIIVVGGMQSPDGAPMRICLLLDLEHLDRGWEEIEAWPGPPRIFPVTASYNGVFYLFSGENKTNSASGISYRNILQDAYRLVLSKFNGTWNAIWHQLSDTPRGVSAGANPAPILGDGSLLVWGGVDKLTSLYTDPESHPGIEDGLLIYDTHTDTWDLGDAPRLFPARVTLPTVVFEGQSYYINGEVKPGIRTNSNVGLSVGKTTK